ncbi:MAG: hypothetical protein ACTSR2_01100 [Candidatus Hodarchaeales archaeon]
MINFRRWQFNVLLIPLYSGATGIKQLKGKIVMSGKLTKIKLSNGVEFSANLTSEDFMIDDKGRKWLAIKMIGPNQYDIIKWKEIYKGKMEENRQEKEAWYVLTIRDIISRFSPQPEWVKYLPYIGPIVTALAIGILLFIISQAGISNLIKALNTHTQAMNNLANAIDKLIKARGYKIINGTLPL